MIKKFIAPISGTLTTLVSFVGVAHASSLQPPLQTVYDLTTAQNLFCNIISWFFWIVITISVIMVLYAAYTYVTATDNSEKTERARKTLTYAAVGIAVALIAVGFPHLIGDIFPGGAAVYGIGNCI